MSLVYLGLGTNLGDKPMHLHAAVQALTLEVGSVLAVSAFYNSKPWGYVTENEFLNAVVLVETNLPPFGLLAKVQQIERDMGRNPKSGVQYEDRPIDIDILLFDNLILHHPTLTIPHALLAKRDFVLLPLSELAPDLVHPVLGKTIRELIIELRKDGME